MTRKRVKVIDVEHPSQCGNGGRDVVMVDGMVMGGREGIDRDNKGGRIDRAKKGGNREKKIYAGVGKEKTFEVSEMARAKKFEARSSLEGRK